MGAQLLLNPLVGGELTQILGNLSAVFDHEASQVAVPGAKHEVVCLPELLGGGSEWEVGVGKAGAREFRDNAFEVAWVGSDGGHLGRMGIDLGFPRGHVGVGWVGCSF